MGPAGHEVELLAGLPGSERSVADASVSGRSQLLEPARRVAVARLDGRGRATIEVELPEGVPPGLLALQAWIRPADAADGGTLTNRIELD